MATILPHFRNPGYIPQTTPKQIECSGIFDFVLNNKKWIEKELDFQIKLEYITNYNAGVFFTISPNISKGTIFISTSNIDHPTSHQDHCIVWKEQIVTITKENKGNYDISKSDPIIKNMITYYNNSKVVQDIIINLYTIYKRNEKLNQLI